MTFIQNLIEFQGILRSDLTRDTPLFSTGFNVKHKIKTQSNVFKIDFEFSN